MRRAADTNDIARAGNADRAWRAGGVRARFDPARAPAKAERGPWRAGKEWADRPTNAAPEARGDQAPGHRQRNSGRSYNVSAATISRLAA